MRELVLIGVGAGDPEWVTLAAVRAIQEIDVLFVVVKEREYDDLVEARRSIIERHRTRPLTMVELLDPPRPWQSVPDYPAAVAAWRAHRLESWGQAVAGHLGEGQSGGFLVWGDPSLYESTLAIVEHLVASASEEITYRVIPGVSSVLALAAAHRIPLNRQGRAVQISPARMLASGMPEGVDDVVVMLDGKQAFASIDPAGLDIYWGAYLGTPEQLLVSGPLGDVAEEIIRVRADAAARLGWVFDTYLLRRRDREPARGG
ncbi:precorrin-6A synthase (deacetylating) [Propioniciclava sp. MC1595]|uniref:precorrin-6A synthase (deacetylating) n=1 Tax=Propioniciclava sp. MC1595 TaxID=2760308 RepID=UPI001662490D|nr:precorrin-6A synthase (deacetylating) [Propioniciclava sp. MC1595]MBB1493746.1 precorrin-6A synthase (deacetylating) [Propioniciclava sp. MC1595]QTE25050.1 precorrin-6A synthase (deacetylating) [Propioniciclava sp. MC1595]